MKQYKIKPLSKLRATLAIPADKSISHRALLLSALAEGKTEISGLLDSADTNATLECLKKLPLKVSRDRSRHKLTISSPGPVFDLKGSITFPARESGTTMRLLCGFLAGQPFRSVLTGSPALKKRPMRRVTHPLRMMGALISGQARGKEEYPPLIIEPTEFLQGITYHMPQASAQVKSALLLASLFSRTAVKIKEPYPCRDHTERMLSLFKAKIRKERGYIVCGPSRLKTPGKIRIPADISSAAFFIVLGIILPDSQLCLCGVGINPTRTGLITVLKRMGADIRFARSHTSGEPYADIIVRSSKLKATTVRASEIPLMIDEVPVLMIAAAYARGTTRIQGISELKVKETDRITSMLTNLKKAGVQARAVTDKQNGWSVSITGSDSFKAARFRSFNDHRTAMSLIVFGLASGLEHTIDDIQCINKSFPEFIPTIKKLK